MEPLKILLASDTYPPQINGAAVFTQRLARGLASRSHQVTVLGPGTRFRDEVAVEPAGDAAGRVTVFRYRSFPVKPVHPHFRIIDPRGIQAKVRRVIDGFRPDIIHIQNHFQLGTACLKYARRHHTPIVGTNHFMPDNLFEVIPGPLTQVVASAMWKQFLHRYNQLDLVTAPSVAARRMLLDLGLRTESVVISNGIDLQAYQKLDPSEEHYRKYGLRRDVPRFLTVGRLEKDKNVDLIIRATAEASRNQPLQTVLVGQGRDEAEFKSLSHRLGLDGVVCFTGAVSDEEVRMLYSMADVYVAAGGAELQGIAVMEAMAMSLPVLAANAVALPELVRDGENGFLFSLKETDLAEKMLQTLSQSEQLPRMGLRSRNLIQAHDLREVLGRFEVLYCAAISSGQRNNLADTRGGTRCPEPKAPSQLRR